MQCDLNVTKMHPRATNARPVFQCALYDKLLQADSNIDIKGMIHSAICWQENSCQLETMTMNVGQWIAKIDITLFKDFHVLCHCFLQASLLR